MKRNAKTTLCSRNSCIGQHRRQSFSLYSYSRPTARARTRKGRIGLILRILGIGLLLMATNNNNNNNNNTYNYNTSGTSLSTSLLRHEDVHSIHDLHSRTATTETTKANDGREDEEAGHNEQAWDRYTDTENKAAAANGHQQRHEQQHDNDTVGIIDGMLQGHYPVLPISSIPRPITPLSLVGAGASLAASAAAANNPAGFATLRRVRWNNRYNGSAVPRHYGKGIYPATPAAGGRTVRGQWPDKLSQLVLILILKNGSTTMGAAFDQLSQRLGGLNRTSYIANGKAPRYVEQELVPNWNRTLLFTILRDPVDRFLSSTCQDYYVPKGGRGGPCIVANDNVSPAAAATTLNATLNCIVDRIRHGIFTTHQISQHATLYNTVGSFQEGRVTVLPFGIHNRLQEEMGVVVDKGESSRDDNDHHHHQQQQEHLRKRQNQHYKDPIVEGLCGLTADDLSREHLNAICDVYQMDVDLVRTYTQQTVPLCN